MSAVVARVTFPLLTFEAAWGQRVPSGPVTEEEKAELGSSVG